MNARLLDALDELYGEWTPDRLDTVDSLDLLLDSDADALFDLLGCRSKMRNADRDDFDIDIRKTFLLDRGDCRDATRDHQHQHQVRGNVIAREPLDRAVHYGLWTIAESSSWASFEECDC